MSNSVASQQKRFIRLAPSNNASTFSPIGAQPIIRFSVADVQGLAMLQDARLNFKVDVYKTGTTRPVQADDFNIDPTLGFCSSIDQVIVSSRRFGTQLEQVVNYGRLEKSYYASKMSPKMMASGSYTGSKAVGMGRYDAFEGQSHSAKATDARALAMRKSLISQQEVSIPFHIGMFLTDAPLDLSAVGGLEIAIYLQKPEAMFYGAAVTTSATFSLSDVSLTMPILYKSADMIKATPSEQVVEFLNWTSLFSVLDSTVSSIAHRVYFSGLVSAIHNALPTAAINNNEFNQFALMNPGVERLTFLRDGQRSPLEKTMVVQDNRDDALEDKSSTFPEVLSEYLSAWMPYKDLKHTQVIPENIKGIVQRDGVFGLGCNYSPDSAGIPISGVLGVNLQSKIEEYTPAAPTITNTEPYALFSFYLSRQAYVASPQGLKAM